MAANDMATQVASNLSWSHPVEYGKDDQFHATTEKGPLCAKPLGCFFITLIWTRVFLTLETSVIMLSARKVSTYLGVYLTAGTL